MLTLVGAIAAGGLLPLAWMSSGADFPAPGLPKTFTLPADPVSAAASHGYLPLSSSVDRYGNYRISAPLWSPDGRAGIQPDMALQYSSGSRTDGLVGKGWSLSGFSSITRCGKTLASEGAVAGVGYDTEDAFCLDGMKLVPVETDGDEVEYRTENDTFAKVTATSAGSVGLSDFEVRLKNGRIRTYTPVTAPRMQSKVTWTKGATPVIGNLSEPAGTPHVMWLIDEERDRAGNSMHFEYTNTVSQGALEIVPDRITYTAHGDEPGRRYVRIRTEARPDPRFSWTSGVKIRLSRRVSAIESYAPNPVTQQMVSKYVLSYGPPGAEDRSLLTSIEQCAGAGGCLWKKNFDWSLTTRQPTFTNKMIGTASPPAQSGGDRASAASLVVADLNGDGLDDIALNQGGTVVHDNEVRLGTRRADGAAQPLSRRVTNSAPNPALVRPVDVNGDGRAEVWGPGTARDRNRLFKWNDTTGTFEETGVQSAENTCGVVSGGRFACAPAEWADFNGDGLLDLAEGRFNGYTPSTHDIDFGTYAVRYSRPGASLAEALEAAVPTGGVRAGCRAAVGDLDGDGRADLLVQRKDYAAPGEGRCKAGETYAVGIARGTTRLSNHDNSAGTDAYSFLLTAPNGTEWGSGQGDFNGDGLADSILNGRTLWNTGNGVTVAAGLTSAGVRARDGVAADLNNDGLADLIDLNNSLGRMEISVAEGDGSFHTSEHVSGRLFLDTALDTTLARLGDFNGDGRTDVVFITADGTIKVAEQNASTSDRITGFTDEDSASRAERVSYSNEWSAYPAGDADNSCTYPLRCVRDGLTVVRSVTAEAHGLERTIHYAYDKPVAHMRGRGFLGFTRVTVWDPSTPMETTTTYDPGRGDVAETGACDPCRRHYLRGSVPVSVRQVIPLLNGEQLSARPAHANARVTLSVPSRELRRLNEGRTVALLDATSDVDEWEESVNLTWDEDFSAANSGKTHLWAIGSVPGNARHLHSSATYDDFGNVKESVDARRDGVTRTLTTTYENRTGPWLIGLVQDQSQTRDEPGTGAETTLTRRLHFHHNDFGRLDLVEVERDNKDAGVRSTRTYHHDDYGNISTVVLSAEGEPDRTSHVEFDAPYPGAPDEHIYPSQFWSEHTDSAHSPSVWLVTHPGLGVPIASMDVNGAQNSASYDGFGRVLSQTTDGGETSTFRYEPRTNSAGAVGTRTVSTTGADPAVPGSGQITVVDSDPAGAVVRRSSTGFDGTAIAVEAVYDRLGRLVTESRPAREPGTRGWTRYDYDGLGRLLDTTLPGGKHIRSEYPSMTEKITTDQEGHRNKVGVDADGRVISTSRMLQRPAAADKEITMRYTYAPFDLVKRVEDPEGVTTDFTYDTLGRRSGSTEPDRGTTVTHYNGFGEVRDTTVPGGMNSYTYDDLGRTTQVSTPEGNRTFTWDTAVNGLGQLARADSPDGIALSYRYDSLGRLSGMDLKEKTTTYSLDRDYDSHGRINTITYPQVPGRDRLRLKYGYNAWGYTTTVSDASGAESLGRLWQATARNADLALTHGQIGTSGLTLDQDFAPDSGSLVSTTVSKDTDKRSEIGYTYWDNGLVRTRTTKDGSVQRRESFGYDSLDRLTTWGVGSAGTADPEPRLSDVTYAYSDSGNLTDISRGTPSEHRTYGKPDGSQPHTLTGLDDLVTGAHTDFTYDEHGRQTTSEHRTLDYTSFDLPDTSTIDGVKQTFQYDAFGARVKKTGPDEAVLYLKGFYERHQRGSQVEHVFRVPGIDGLGADIVYDPASTPKSRVLYHVEDALGSTVQTLTDEGKTLSRTYYDPFGERVAPDGDRTKTANSAMPRGFTGHEHDAGGVINMNGRLYDTIMKRFLSADPLISNPLNSQTWNPYSYVGNSPLNHTDPSGLGPCVYAFIGEDPGPPPGCGDDTPAGNAAMTVLQLVSNGVLEQPGWGSGAPTAAGATVPGSDANGHTEPCLLGCVGQTGEPATGLTPTEPSAEALPALESPGGGRIKDKRDPDPSDVVTFEGVQMHEAAANALGRLIAAARKAGIGQNLLKPVSGYRSYAAQKTLFDEALKKYGSEKVARQWVAPPGSSAHQSGRAIDLDMGSATVKENAAKQRETEAYKWMVENAESYGFYPYDKEPWHWEYNPPAPAKP
ncbi:FG-GAP-like repeat-containing protein [Streptomyces sp. NPDC004065]|uniref:FG-GAP-like repeat-containing protein n=1 Tax=Streptomyces sp. NPDC004065 TaxID=3364689 RepID=UPI00384EE1BD